MTFEEAEKIISRYECSRYSGLYNAKDHCLVLALCEMYEKLDTLQEAIEVYERQQQRYIDELYIVGD